MPGPDYIPRSPEEEERTRKFIEEITRPSPEIDIDRWTEEIKRKEREQVPA